MSLKLTYLELVNLAIGTPEIGTVNFNALHFFLHAILDHLNLSNEKLEISQDEKDFINRPQPPGGSTPVSTTVSPTEQVELGAKRSSSSSIFHQMHERISNIEKQLGFLNDTPTTMELLARSEAGKLPAQDMWQMMQLKKKMEQNEEGMTKAMLTLQDLLSNISSLRKASDGFQDQLGNLQQSFSQFNVNIDNVKEHLQQLDEQAKAMDEIRNQIGQVKQRSGSIPDFSDMVEWRTLYEMIAGKPLAEKDQGARERSSRELLTIIGQMPERHEELAKHLARLEEQLGKPIKVTPDRSPELLAELQTLQARMEQLQSQNEQGQESLNTVSEQLQNFKKQYEKLQKAMDKLIKSTDEIQLLRDMLEQLDVTKADKARIQEEMEVKADKSALEAKVNLQDLKVATNQLSDMMQDLLQKMSLQDKDWQKALEKLFVDMDCKLDRMALDPLSKQLEDVWKVVKKFLSEGPRFDADSAAGFKKQLFERVKCISCDRPVTMMTGPHMITIRKSPLRPRPASANGYEFLAQPHRKELESGGEMALGQPQQTCWQCQAHHQACTIKQLSRSQDLTTIYPYGDPGVITYDSTEVDILGVNGVLYKGRVNSQSGERLLALQRELTVRTRRPQSALRMERARSATSDCYVSPYSSAASVRRFGQLSSINLRTQESQPLCLVESLEPVVPPILPSAPSQDGGGVMGN